MREYLAVVGSYFKHEGTRRSSELNVKEYLKYVEGRFAQMDNEASIYLDATSKGLVVKMLETNLIEPNLNYILGGFETVVDEKYACKGLFNMVGRVEGYEVMREAVGKWVKGKCGNIIKAEKVSWNESRKPNREENFFFFNFH